MVSGGRLDFGIGASWLRGEWDAVGLDFDTRGARVDEAIEVCRRLWSEPVVEHHGRFFDFDPVMFEPKPVQRPGPRLHIGGDGPAALRRAATVGDGWVPMNHTVDEIPAAAATIAELRDRAGRHGRTEVTLGAHDRVPLRRGPLRRGRSGPGLRQAVEEDVGRHREPPGASLPSSCRRSGSAPGFDLPGTAA